MTVQELRNKGYKVKVFHNRLYNGYHKWQVGGHEYIQRNTPVDPDTKGGSTEIVIDSPFGEHFHGVAICSKKDNFNKKLGVKIALGRCGLNF